MPASSTGQKLIRNGRLQHRRMKMCSSRCMRQKEIRSRSGVGFEVVNRGGSIPSGTVAIPNLPPIGLPSNFTTSEKTFYGPRGTFEYTRNNMRGKGESLSLTAFAGRLDQRGGAYRYIDPNFIWSKWTLRLWR